MAYEVVITPPAKHQLEMYIAYTISELKNKQAARAIKDDAKKTAERLSDVAESLALCDDEVLAKNGYHRIFFDKHKFFMVYRMDGKIAIVEAMYHDMQDYASVFARKMNLK